MSASKKQAEFLILSEEDNVSGTGDLWSEEDEWGFEEDKWGFET